MAKPTPSATGSRWLTRLLLGLGVWLVVAAEPPPPVAAGAEAALPALRQAPFKAGEKLAYRLSWGPFTVGMLTLEVAGPVVHEGRNALHFIMEARTNEFADSIYRVRQRGDTWVTPEISRSLVFQHHQEEGKLKRDYTVRFHWDTRLTEYQSATKTRKPLRLNKDTFDPFGVMLYFRAHGLDGGANAEIAVTDGKRLGPGVLTIVGREKLKIGERTWDTILVEPDMKDVGGVFEKSRDAKLQIWFSDDARRVPLKVSSSVAVGKFTAELLSDTPGNDPILLAPRVPLPPLLPPATPAAAGPAPAQ